MSQVLDYSSGFPGAQNIKNKGYLGAVRYAGRPGNPKDTTTSELLDFSNHDLGMAAIFEGAATDWRGGFNAGLDNARRTRDHTNSMGFPADRPIYMAVDQDVVRSGEFATMIEYLRGANASLGGPSRTGVYGEADVIDRARDAGVAAYFWQTAAWSGGRRTFAHLYQRIGTVNVGGVACDVNDVLQEDWGQHNYEGDGMGAVEDLQAQQVDCPDGRRRGALDALVQGMIWSNEAVHAANGARDAAIGARDAVLAKLAGIGQVQLSDEQLTGISERLATSLGVTLGASVAGTVLKEASRLLAGE